MEKTKDRAKRTPLNTGGEHRFSGRVAVTKIIPIESVIMVDCIQDVLDFKRNLCLSSTGGCF